MSRSFSFVFRWTRSRSENGAVLPVQNMIFRYDHRHILGLLGLAACGVAVAVVFVGVVFVELAIVIMIFFVLFVS
jgi:hypothetical protein